MSGKDVTYGSLSILGSTTLSSGYWWYNKLDTKLDSKFDVVNSKLNKIIKPADVNIIVDHTLEHYPGIAFVVFTFCGAFYLANKFIEQFYSAPSDTPHKSLSRSSSRG